MNLPNAVDKEKLLLQTILTKGSVEAGSSLELLKPEHFFDGENRRVFNIISELYKKNEDINELSVRDYAERHQIEVDSIDHYGMEFCDIDRVKQVIYDRFMLRELYKLGIELQTLNNRSDSFETIEEIERKIFNITQGAFKKNFLPLSFINQTTLELLHSIKSKGANNFLVRTNFLDLDNLIGGFKNGELIVLAGRPAMGKTALALNIAKNISDDYAVGFNSLEMSATQLSTRMISQESEISVMDLLSGHFQESQMSIIMRAASKNNLPLFIDDTPALSTIEFRSKAKRLKAEKNIRLLVVDYLQLMKGVSKEGREREISEISQSLKNVARELDIPVLALSQLNRKVEDRTSKEPQLSDLRESGAIEQDADVVLFIHRPEVYGQSTDETGKDTKNLAKLIVAKNRNGAVGKIDLTFVKERTQFQNYLPEFIL